MSYRVYVIRNREGKFYIGLSNDTYNRVNQHNAGESKWTRGKGPWTLIWQGEEMVFSDARKLELLLKRRRWILQDDWPATARFIIPRLRDRWFKSSPRNQFLRGMLGEQLFFCTKAALALHEWRSNSMLRVT